MKPAAQNTCSFSVTWWEARILRRAASAEAAKFYEGGGANADGISIGVAINGSPIFNPIKNDGRTDTQPAGELDVFGGHCGRADDYHSHVAPLHLVDMVGIANLTGYALDRAPPVWTRSTTPPKKYPYMNRGLRGVVEVRDDAITPQPRTMPVRPAGRPLRGAKIIAFTGPGPNRYSLEYTVGSEHRRHSAITMVKAARAPAAVRKACAHGRLNCANATIRILGAPI